MGKRGADPYGKPLSIIELFRRLNQQFNDNCYRDRYHRINEKRQGVNTMNLKEAFRFQNKLQSMMTDAQSILGNNGNITKVQNTYLRHKVMAEHGRMRSQGCPPPSIARISPRWQSSCCSSPTSGKVERRNHKAKVSLPLGAGLDGEVSPQPGSARDCHLLRHMAGLRNGEVLTSNGESAIGSTTRETGLLPLWDVKRVDHHQFLIAIRSGRCAGSEQEVR